MIKINCNYNLKHDIEFVLESANITICELSEATGISHTTLESVINNNTATNDVYEKFYSYVYNNNYRINKGKEEILKESNHNILFHGSKYGLDIVSCNGSRNSCDFGQGFYLGETYTQALAFICEKSDSSIYSFKCKLDGLKIKRFQCDLDWILAICYFRGSIQQYKMTEKLEKIIKEVQNADVVIAPIANNKMFYIMSQFAEGEINVDVTLHSLSASNLGLQYIFRTEKALQRLIPIEKYYISNAEREKFKHNSNERAYEIDTKLKLAKREFKNGLYIEEILK